MFQKLGIFMLGILHLISHRIYSLCIYNYKTPLTNVHSQYSVAAGLICVGARATSQQARAKAKRT
jgi:hypothetical protein